MIEWFRNSGLVIYIIAQLSLINVSIISFSNIMQGKDHSLDIVLKFCYQAYIFKLICHLRGKLDGSVLAFE